MILTHSLLTLYITVILLYHFYIVSCTCQITFRVRVRIGNYATIYELLVQSERKLKGIISSIITETNTGYCEDRFDIQDNLNMANRFQLNLEGSLLSKEEPV